jgi:hypothetical protein
VVQSPSYWEKIVQNRALVGIHTISSSPSFSRFFAVKSTVVEHFDSLVKEAEILKEFINYLEIVRGFFK